MSVCVPLSLASICSALVFPAGLSPTVSHTATRELAEKADIILQLHNGGARTKYLEEIA